MKKTFRKLISLSLIVLLLIPTLILMASAVPANTFLWPVPSSYSMSRGFSSSGHKAIDVTKCEGKDIVASYDGVVYSYVNKCQHYSKSCTSCDSTGMGVGLILKHTINGTTYYTYYAHMQYNSVPSAYRTKNATVKQGDVIGKVGSSGNSTGPHLHFTITQGATWSNYINNNPTDTSKHSITSSNGVSYKYSMSYTLTYNANGGYGAPATQTGATSYTIPTNAPTRFGYVFEGWSRYLDHYSGFDPGSTTYLNGDMTLYAYWKEIDITNVIYCSARFVGTNQKNYYKFTPSVTAIYTFKTNNPYDNFDPIGTIYNSSGTSLISDDDSAGNRNFSISYNMTAGSTYYLEIKDYSGNTGGCSLYVYKSLYYDANGGSGAPSVQTGQETYTISSSTPTRQNYTFLGWSTNRNATSAEYSAGDSISVYETTTLYAVWRYNPPTSYTLSYNANGGSGAPSSQTGSTTYTISSTRPTRSGYTFLGWSKSSSATSASYTAGDTITLSANTTLYAVWRYNAPTTYTLYYNANGGSGAPSSQSGSTTYTISSTRPTRSGYTFLGWSKSSSSYATANYSAGDTITLTSNTTLYAVWKANSSSNNNIKITIRNNPGTVNLNYGDTIRLYADAENLPSNSRIGWYVDDGSTISAKVSDDNTYCEITAKGTGTVTIAAKAVDANGNIMTDSQGNQIGDIQKINTKTSFWLKIVSFFKNLFGANRTTIQALKNVF